MIATINKSRISMVGRGNICKDAKMGPLGWVVSSCGEGMAAPDPFQPFPDAAEGAVFFDRFNGVLRACRGKAAIAPQEWAHGSLVKANASDHRVRNPFSHAKRCYRFALTR